MRARLITNFNSIKEWKSYCFNAHSLYLKNKHFKKWINERDVYIFNFSSLKKGDIKYIKSGLEDAIKLARLHFKVFYGSINSLKKIINLKDKKINSNKLSKTTHQRWVVFEHARKFLQNQYVIKSSDILKMTLKKRKESHKEQANIFIFKNPIKSSNAIIKDGEALTYVSEGIVIFTFEAFKKYSHNFLRCRAKHEALHLLGLNSHHEDIKVKGYKYNTLCNMNYNAPTQNLCKKCKDGLLSFWEGVKDVNKNA